MIYLFVLREDRRKDRERKRRKGLRVPPIPPGNQLQLLRVENTFLSSFLHHQLWGVVDSLSTFGFESDIGQNYKCIDTFSN